MYSLRRFKKLVAERKEKDQPDLPDSTRPQVPEEWVSEHLTPEFIEWPNSSFEKQIYSVERDPFGGEGGEGLDGEEEGPSCSSSSQTRNNNEDLIFNRIRNQLKLFFPDTHTTMVDTLREMMFSSRTDNDMQSELIDLLGFEQFELATEILENRMKICMEIKNEEQNLANYEVKGKKPAVPGILQTVSVQSTAQNSARKQLRKEQKRAQKELKRVVNAFGNEERLELELSMQRIAESRQLEVDSMKWTPTIKSAPYVKHNYPYVFDAAIQSSTTPMSFQGMQFMLPEGSKREKFKTYESVYVPPAKKGDIEKIEHVYVKDMDEIGQLGFKGFEKLNVIQSIVFDQAYKTKENLLICAPTGAGKTNIAMLTILNIINEHRNLSGEIMLDDFKMIYIAPMKALATEMTESFGKRLAPLGLKVKELTGDTQLSRSEIADTQMLVLTPEKWDVITRKGSTENSLISLVRLLIIDEVHLLHDERGPVIETLVARTLRQVELSQTGIRIVGLSATLPNYIDVAEFLRVNPYKGLFFFDGRFRPVPLTQKFIGVNKMAGTRHENMKYMDEVCYNQVFDFVKRGHQVLVFVHTRKGTTELGETFIHRAAALGHSEVFQSSARESPGYHLSEKAVSRSRDKHKLVNLFGKGVGVHHAGLCRADRILMEKCFAQGHISVMVCTATLAWGVNLPAHAVVIRGTDVFDNTKGVFVDLGVLDVQQIFGRAGRPQFENEGHGIIITTHEKLQKYLTMLVHQYPIESQFSKKLHDNLNAEVALGTVSTIDEGVEWLTYTYMYVRALKNPMSYGVKYGDLEKDPDLRQHFSDLLRKIAIDLDDHKMIRFNTDTEFLFITDLGRIASNFYVKYETIDMLSEASKAVGLPVSFTGFMPDDMALALISMSSEFSQLQCREEEFEDLEELQSFGCMLRVRGGGLASVPGKVNVLLQALISRTRVRNSALMSEQLYVQQNAGRLCRAMFEIVLKNGWAHASNSFLSIAKCIEKQLWMNQSSLRQFLALDLIPITWIDKIERRSLTETRLLELSDTELGHMFSCDGKRLYSLLRYLPRMEIDAKFKPITYTIIQVEVILTPSFIWFDKVHGKTGTQSFYLLLEDLNENLIIHQEKIGVGKMKVLKKEPMNVTFTIPIVDSHLTNNFQLRVASEYFVMEDVVIPMSLHNCVLPKSYKAHTDLLDLDPLPVKTLNNPLFESIYPFNYFNPIQAQIFFCLHKTDKSALVGAPTGSGKTLCAELAMFRLLQEHPGKKIVYVAPLKSLVRERVEDWKKKFENNMGYKVVEVSGDFTPDSAQLAQSTILITTPEKWDGISRSWATREYVRQVGLLIIDEIHLLGVDRGAVIEAIVSRAKMISRKSCSNEEPVRLLGLSTALANAGDVGEWLGIPSEAVYNFRPSVRPVPINVHIQGFAGQHYCPRMALMNKPAYKAIQMYSPLKPVLIFVSSRRQTRLTALAFVNLLIADANPKQWLNMEMAELEFVTQSVTDENLKLTLPFGIGMHHAGLSAHERSIVEELFVEKKIQVLIATATLAWGINCPAHLVIVKGTEYFDGKKGKYVDFPVTDVLQMMGRAGRPQFDTSAEAVIYVQDSKKTFYKKFLYEPFPVESSLLPVLPNHVNAEVSSGTVDSKQSVVEYLSGTYLYRRLFANPNYYGLETSTEEDLLKFLTNIVNTCVEELTLSGCIDVNEETDQIKSTAHGRIASMYYLQHETIRFLLKELHSGCTVENMLHILAHVPEYAEVPVRHNEDLINTELQRRMRIRFSTALMGSASIKTHLLFQSHFARSNLPTDYRTDLKSVLDQCIRILQAMREMTVLKGWMTATMNVTILQQMFHTARWHDDSPLLGLPILKEGDLKFIGEDKTIPEFQNELGIEKASSVTDPKLKSRVKRFFEEKTNLHENEYKEVVNALCHWPIVSLNPLKLRNCEGKSVIHIDLNRLDKENWIKVNAGGNYTLKVAIERFGPMKNSSDMHLPQWPKPKQAGWVVLVGDQKNDILMSMTPIMGTKSTKTARTVEVKMPEVRGRRHLSIFLMSDCYLGIDQEYQVPIEVV